jgi:hypothetical protein
VRSVLSIAASSQAYAEVVVSNPASESVVVVSGLLRSGTSMTMQMLASGGLPVLTDARREADESNPRGYYELEAVEDVRGAAGWPGSRLI